MARWQEVERYLDTLEVGDTFTSRAFAAYADVSWSEASAYVQAYLDAQRAPKSRTKYVVARAPGTRTASARWKVGHKANDLRKCGMAFSNDVKQKARGAFEPDLRRIAALNPAAARRAERVIEATLDGAMKVLDAAVRA